MFSRSQMTSAPLLKNDGLLLSYIIVIHCYYHYHYYYYFHD